MAGRQSRGRQKIPLRLISNQDDLYATFSKRRLGLYKKASELSTLCGVDIGIIIFSPTNNPFSFFHPSMESVINCHRNPNLQLTDFARLVDGHTRGRIMNLNICLDEVLEEKHRVKEREKELDEAAKTREKGWWEKTPVESLNKEQVKEWKEWFENLNALVNNRIEQLRNEGSGLEAAFQHEQNDAVSVQNYDHAGVPYDPTDMSHYYGAHQQAHDHNPVLAVGTGDAKNPIHYCYTPGGPSQNFGFPQPEYNIFAHTPPEYNIFATGGSGEAGPSQCFAPPPHNPFASGDVGGAGPSQFWFPRPSTQNLSIGSGDGQADTSSGEAGPSHQQDKNP